ncbi:MAG TPA: sugar ABC transporter substrate-binding protein [Chthonomonadaceae bacterium]|nr:sugar ABC transporter substrate-binding protein [Chthonomonadaceae bacterium]
MPRHDRLPQSKPPAGRERSATCSRRALICAALSSAAAVAAGCGTAGRSSRVELRYMAWGNPEQLGVEQQLVDGFNRQNRDIHVRLFRVPASAYLNKAIIMLASRTAPDVIRIDHYNFPNLVRKEYFRDLSPFADSDAQFDKADIFPAALQEGMYRGRLYGLNVLLGGVMMYYNKALFAAAGQPDPYRLWMERRWTWDRLREAAIAISRHAPDGRPERLGVQIPTFPHNAYILWAFGGEILSADGKHCLLNSPGCARAYQFLADLRWKDRVAPTPSQGALSAFGFESGKLGMTFDWMGMAPRFRRAVKSFDWDVCPVPYGPAGGAGILKGNQLVMSAETAYPEKAWRFMRYLTSARTEAMLYGDKLRRGDPARRSVARSQEFLHASRPPYNTGAYLSALENGRLLPIDARWQEWSTVLNAELDELWGGRDLDAARVLARAASKVDAVLASEEGF